MAEKIAVIPNDDITIHYAQADALKRRAASAVLQSKGFILQTLEEYSVITGGNVEQALDLLSAIMLHCRAEFGNAFARAFLVAVEKVLEGEDDEEESV